MARYPTDEFDDLQPTGRKGAHRRGGPISQTGAIVLVVVLALAALLVVFGAINIIQKSTSNPEDEVAQPPAASEESKAEETPQPSASEVDAVKKTAKVHVLNGSGVSGAAKKFGDHLKSNGWTVADVANHTSSEKVSVVYFSSAEFKTQAAALAAELGIEKVKKSSQFPGEVTVLVNSDLAQKDLDSLGTGGGAGSADGAGTSGD